jgi:hypothetical protein
MNMRTALAQVCTLGPVDRVRRWLTVAPFVRSAIARIELTDGVRLEFESDRETARAVSEFVRVECDCCSRFSYAVSPVEATRRIALDIRAAGPDIEAVKVLYLR